MAIPTVSLSQYVGLVVLFGFFGWIQMNTWLGRVEHIHVSSIIDVSSISSSDPQMYSNLNLDAILQPATEREVVYSSYYCINGEDRRGIVWSSRQCVFTNVGFVGNDTIVFHARSEADDVPLEVKEAVHHYGGSLRVSTTFEPIKYSTYAQKWTDPSVAVTFFSVSDCKLGLQVGHDFDDILTAFNGIGTVGLLSLSNIVMIPNCEKASKMFATAFSKHILLSTFVNEGGIIMHTVHVAPRKREWLTFPSLESGFAAKFYRDRALAVLGIAPRNTTDRTVRIALRQKDRRHTILNYKAVLDKLRIKYPEAEIVHIKPQKMDAKTEIAFMASLDMYITPSGGGSFSGQFLPERSTVVYSDVCWPGNARPEPMANGWLENNATGPEAYCISLDSFCWDIYPYYFKRYIGARDVSQIVYEGTNTDITKRNEHSRLSYSLNVDIRELMNLVDEGLSKADALSVPSTPLMNKSWVDAEQHHALRKWSFQANLMLFPPVRQRLTGFSAHNCLNGEKIQYLKRFTVEPVDWNIRTCVMSNVELSSTGMIVYRQPVGMLPIKLGTQMVDDFLKPERRQFFGVEIQVENTPFDSDPKVPDEDDASCLILARSSHTCAQTLDDVLAESWVLFTSMADAGLMSIHNQFEFVRNDLAHPSACPRSKYLNLVGKPYRPRSGQPGDRHRLPCVILPARATMHIGYSPVGLGLILKLIRDRAWAMFPPSLIRRIDAPRPIIGWNVQDAQSTRLMATITARFASRCDIVNTDGFKQNVTLAKELSLVAAFDVYVASCNQGSHALFLQDGATAIFIDRREDAPSCYKLDSAPHFYKKYLRVPPTSPMNVTELVRAIESTIAKIIESRP